MIAEAISAITKLLQINTLDRLLLIFHRQCRRAVLVSLNAHTRTVNLI
jgi:hypothetical protein